MRDPIEIENIEAMRLREGIDDVQLREAIRRLGTGDCVNLTLLNGAKSCETLLVRITSIKGAAIRGKLVQRPVSTGLSRLRVGFPVVFTKAHIHSLPKEPPTHDQ